MNTLIDKIFTKHFDAILVRTDIQGRKFWEFDQQQVAQAKSELLKAIMECKPGTALADSNLTDKEWSEYEGYVKGITHWENNIKALFGENKER